MPTWRTLVHFNNEMAEILTAIDGLCSMANIIRVVDGKPVAWDLDPQEILDIIRGPSTLPRGTIDLQLPEPTEDE